MNTKENNNSTEKKTSIKRRDFLRKIWIGLGIIALIESIVLITNPFSSKKKAKGTTNTNMFNAGNEKNYKPNSVTAFRSNRFFLSRLKDGGFIALSIKCTHLGCNINWDNTGQKFLCPCHSSWFDNKGEVMHPPATRPLSVHPVEIKNNTIFVNTNVSIKRNSIADTEIVYA